MATRIKDHKFVAEFTEHDTDLRYDLYIHSRKQTFLAKWGDKEMTGDVAYDVRQAMEKLIRDENKLEFFPVIVVQEKAPFADNVPFVAFTQYRTYVAHRRDKDRPLAQISWDDYRGQTDLRVYKTRLWPPGDLRYKFETLPYIHHGIREKTYVLAYSETLWNGLIALGIAIEQMQAKFRALLSTDEGLQKIELAGASALLPSGEKNEEIDSGWDKED